MKKVSNIILGLSISILGILVGLNILVYFRNRRLERLETAEE